MVSDLLPDIPVEVTVIAAADRSFYSRGGAENHLQVDIEVEMTVRPEVG